MDREAVDEVAGPLLKPLGVDGAPLMAVGEWLLPFISVCGVKEGGRVAPWDAAGGGGGMLGGVDRGCVFTSAGESGIAEALAFLSAGGSGVRGVRGAADGAHS